MKRKILLAVGLLYVASAQAQTQKGNGILSGGISAGYEVSKQNQSDTKYTSTPVSVNGTYGKFMADNWMGGIEAQYTGRFNRQVSRSQYSPDIINKSVGQSFSIKPFVRRYWSVGPVLLFAGAGLRLSYNYTDNQTKNGDDVAADSFSKEYSVNPEFTIGANYPLSNRLALQGSANSTILPVSASTIGLGLVYWTGPSGTGGSNLESTLTATQKGNWVVEGGFTVGGSNVENTIIQQAPVSTKDSYVSINASIGHFVADNTLIGVGIGYATYTRKGNNSDQPWQQTYYLAPFVKRYFGTRRLRPTASAAVSINSYRTEGDDPRTPVQVNLGVGLAYLISNRFIVETSLGNLSYSFVKNGEGSTSQAVNLSGQLGSGFSVRYVLNGAH
jgi:hypothetical protein